LPETGIRETSGVMRPIGKKTIAEFVADANAVGLLRDTSVDYAQGYYISRPQPVAELL
jgi:EAL domain-containing protein (putative c-di-GMP-specific phosphodiesterase class I)